MTAVCFMVFLNICFQDLYRLLRPLMPFTEKDIPHLALVNAQGKGWYYVKLHTLIKIIFMLFVYLLFSLYNWFTFLKFL